MPEKKTNNTIQAFWVAIGSLGAFGMTLISTMILSRYFDKSDYGTYRQVLYVYQTLLIVFTLGLPKAYSYFLPRVEDCCAKSLVNKITRLFYFLGGLFSVLLFIFAPQIAFILKNPDLEIALRIFSPVPFLMLPTMGIEGIYAVYQKNRYIALYNILTKSLTLLCVALPVILFNSTYKEALMGFAIASFISFLIATYMKYWCVQGKGDKPTEVTRRDIFQFSLPLLFASLWAMLTQSADSFFISRFFGKDVFAEFSNGSLQLPFVGMIIGACSAVLMPLFSKKVHENADPQTEILPTWRSVFEKTIKITYPLILFFMVFATEIMTTLYGSKYAESGIYFQIMLFLNFFTVISYFPILMAVGALKFYRNIQMYWAISVVVLEYLAVLIFNSPYVVTVVSVLCAVVSNGIMLAFIAKYFKVGILGIIPIKLAVKIVILAIIFLSLIKLIINGLFPEMESLMYLSISFILFLIIYLTTAPIVNIDYGSIISPIYKRLIKQ